MDVRNCRICGRLYNYIGGSYRNMCPNCVKALEEKFQDVKIYINDNPTASISQIAQDCEVSVKQIEQWVREERLYFSDDSPIGIECEMCGATIKSGRYCEACKLTMATQLGSMYQNKKPKQEPKKTNQKDAARMRYLDKQ